VAALRNEGRNAVGGAEPREYRARHDPRYDQGFFNALVRMFEQALQTIGQISASDRRRLVARLDKVRTVSHNFGYGVGEDMDYMLAQCGEE
jgi:hypothetical protein